MDSDDITRWIGGLNQGDERAAEALWNQYFYKLTQVARQRLDARTGRSADEEDAALSAIHSFCRGMRAGRYPQLAGRDELWRLLVTIVVHKVGKQRRGQRRIKRGGGHTRGESAFIARNDEADVRGIEQVLGTEPTAEAAAMLTESCEQLLASLNDNALRKIADLKLAGYTNDEIAEQLDCTTRSVERKLNRIRKRWTELGMAHDSNAENGTQSP